MLSALTLMCAFGSSLCGGPPFGVRVIDDQTGRGIPMVELSTVNHVRFLTDSNGLVAIDEPAMENQETYFHVRAHGYELSKDGFGYRGKRLKVMPGEIETIELRRINVAERLYRITGEGIYRDSILLNRPVPVKQPLLNGLVFGSDSVQVAVHRGKIHWFWGDTNQPSYPLGNFHVPGAVSRLPEDGGLDPNVGVDLEYYVDEKGFARPTAKMPGPGPTWIDAVVSLPDETTGRDRLFAKYVKIQPPLTAYEKGLVEFDDEAKTFRHVKTLAEDAAVYPKGHDFVHKAADVEHVYFTNPYPLVRARATAQGFTDVDRYEAFTCLMEGSDPENPRFDRFADGKLRYSWKTNVAPLSPADQKKLVDKGLIEPNQGLLQLKDVESGKPILAHSGTVNWNEFRKRWVMILLELYGDSLLGEIWYAEADTPEGPWVFARKVVTHDKYSFYNPAHHPFFDQQDGRILFFEGTYTELFSGASVPTPRYDYNQIMYRLDLADERLNLPVAMYRQPTESGAVVATFSERVGPGPIAFFAWERAAGDSVAVFQAETPTGPRLQLEPGDDGRTRTAFHAPAVGRHEGSSAGGLTPLFEFQDVKTGAFAYSPDSDFSPKTHRRLGVLCRVWANPLNVRLPHETQTME